ncbi:MAG: hypothetical protein IT332_02035 [Ardenticatenales bacterium]|nr:hypothetical protein [Ardenticatenales bacterium]
MSLRRILGRPTHPAPVRAVASVMLLVAAGLAMNVVRLRPASPPTAAPLSSAIAQSDPSPPPPAVYLPRLDAAPPPDLAVEGQVGGATWAVAARGDTAYVGIGPRIVAWDLRPTDRGDAPTELAKSAVLGRAVRDLVLDGDRLYAALGGAGVAVFDVANPARIALTTERDLPGESGSLVLDAGRLYVALGRRGIVVLDAASPALDELGAWQAPPDGDDPAKVFDIAPHGQLAYAAVDEHGLLVLDVADPARMTIVGEDAAHGEARRVTRVGETAWVAADNGEVHVYDLREPRRPRSFAQPNERFVRGDEAVAGFALAGDRIAISGGPLEVWDVADPFTPRRLGTGTDGLFARHADDGGDGVAFAGARLVVAGGTNGKIVVVTAAGGASLRGNVTVDGLSNAWRSVLYGGPDGKTLYSGDDRFDVARPSEPRPLGVNPMQSYTVDGSPAAGLDAVVVDGPVAYSVGDRNAGQLIAFDLTDSAAPRRVGVIDDRAADQNWGSGFVFRGWTAGVLAKAGDRIVLGGYCCHFAVVDAADPAAMRLLAVRGVQLRDAIHAPSPAPAASYTALALTDDGRTAVGVDAGQHGDFGYADWGGIQAIDLTDPSDPRFGPHLDSPGMQQNDVVIHGHHAYVAAGKGGLRVYNIADIDAVREVGAWDDGDEKAVAIVMAWPHVLLARSKRLDLIDICDPGHPTRLTSASVPGVVKALRLYRGRAWVLTEDAGLVGYGFRGVGQ